MYWFFSNNSTSQHVNTPTALMATKSVIISFNRYCVIFITGEFIKILATPELSHQANCMFALLEFRRVFFIRCIFTDKRKKDNRRKIAPYGRSWHYIFFIYCNQILIIHSPRLCFKVFTFVAIIFNDSRKRNNFHWQQADYFGKVFAVK